jgi:hypothetical protein
MCDCLLCRELSRPLFSRVVDCSLETDLRAQRPSCPLYAVLPVLRSYLAHDPSFQFIMPEFSKSSFATDPTILGCLLPLYENILTTTIILQYLISCTLLLISSGPTNSNLDSKYHHILLLRGLS